MIDIIIPCYDAHKTLDKTLLSICYQTIRDKCKILLVNDCSSKGYESFIDKYNKYLDIKVLNLDTNSGSGVARREGINNSSSKYIVFIDSDDLFYSADSLNILLSKIEEGYDLVSSVEYDEKRDLLLINNGDVHGKIYRRSFLQNNNITFNNTRFHEDNYFNNLVILSGAKTYNLDDCTYYYYFNKKSITNDGKEFKRLEILVSNVKELFDIAKEKNYDIKLVYKFKYEKYCYFNRIFKAFNKKEQQEFIDWTNKYQLDYLDYIGLDNEKLIDKIINKKGDD
jgi:glycosyltransferase involved in cell wall biosynthesis